MSFLSKLRGNGGGAERSGSAGPEAASFTARREGLKPLPKQEVTDPYKLTVDYYVSQPQLPLDVLRAQLGQQHKGTDGKPDAGTVQTLTDRITSGWSAKESGNPGSGN